MLVANGPGHKYLHNGSEDARWTVCISRHPKYKTGWCVWARENIYHTRHHMAIHQKNGKTKIKRYATLDEAHDAAARLWGEMPSILETLEAEELARNMARGPLRSLEDVYQAETSADF